jgi:tetratricopeptide (TPR) repeat protein
MRALPRLLVLFILTHSAMGAVRAWEDVITLPTYLEGAADLKPVLDAMVTEGANYPYTNRTNLGSQRAMSEWRRLVIENEYLVCTFLPDLGGHLYTCVDKLSGRPMFHGNGSIKKGLISLRGAWVSLGIELNFPIGHTRVTVSPVDFAWRQDRDRAVVWVGARDRVTGMEWRVEFVLREGVAMLEQNVTLSNQTAVRHPYYWWSNAAVKLEPDTRLVLPTNLVTIHGENRMDSWSVGTFGVDKGVDQSMVSNMKGALSVFAHGTREPFFAAYQGSSRTATVHVADPAAVPGKKLWSWGSNDAEIRRALSDDNSEYIEIQAGVFPAQEDLEFLGPFEERRFTEYWLPARELDGITRANTWGVLFFGRRTTQGKSELVAELNVTHGLNGARLRILKDSATVWEQTEDLAPARTLSHSISGPAAGAYRFELLDDKGTLLLAHTEGVYDADPVSSAKLGLLPQPDCAHPASAEAFVNCNQGNERNGHDYWATVNYPKGLEQFPRSAAIEKAAGRLAVSQQRFREGVQTLEAAAAALPGDAEVTYYLGVAQAALGQEEAAQATWQRIAADPAFGMAARVETDASLARRGKIEDALERLRQRRGVPGFPLRAGRMEVALLRAAGKTAEATERLNYWLAIDPIDSFLQWEQAPARPNAALERRLAADPERVLDIVDQYLSLGLYKDALEALDRTWPPVPANETEPGAVLPQNYALAAYYRGYCRQKAGGDGSTDFHVAAGLPLERVFPSRTSSFPVLRAALAANASDASAHWLLGLLDMNADLVDEAIAEWQKARALRHDIPELYPLLSQALGDLKHDKAAALAVMAEAPKSSTARPAPNALEAGQTPPGPAPNSAEPTAAAAPPNAQIVLADVPVNGPTTSGTAASSRGVAGMALMQVAGGNLAGGKNLFVQQNFPQEKQPAEIRKAYIEVQLQLLRADVANRHCELVEAGFEAIGGEDKGLTFTMYGFDAFLKEPRFQYYLADMEAACGEQKPARKRWMKLAKENDDPSSENFAFPALAAARLNPADGKGRLEGAESAVEKRLAAAEPENRGLLLYSQGTLLMALGQREKAAAAFEGGAKAMNRGESQYLNLLALREAAGR